MEAVWLCMCLASIIYSIFTGTADMLVQGMMNGASGAVTLCIGLCAIYGVWGGFMENGRQGGLLTLLSRLLKPVLKLFFRGADAASEAITLNLAANMLGMGNAATPAGQEAVRLLSGTARAKENIDALLILNNSALTLIPSTVLAMRTAAGSAAPAEIVPCALAASVVSTAIAAVLIKVFIK